MLLIYLAPNMAGLSARVKTRVGESAARRPAFAQRAVTLRIAGERAMFRRYNFIGSNPAVKAGRAMEGNRNDDA